MSDRGEAELVERAAHLAATEHPDDDGLPATPLSRTIEACIHRIGDAVSWIWLLLLGVIVLNVVLRYAFASGRIELEELQWHLYAAGFLCGLSYCIPSDSHIRVDFLRDRMRPRTRAWIELYGLLLLVLPFVALVAVFAGPFVAEAWRQGEVSASAGGLPARWVVKATLPAAMVLVGLAAVARVARVGRLLFGVSDGRRGTPPGAG